MFMPPEENYIYHHDTITDKLIRINFLDKHNFKSYAKWLLEYFNIINSDKKDEDFINAFEKSTEIKQKDYMETIQNLKKDIDKALENKDKETFLKLSQRYKEMILEI